MDELTERLANGTHPVVVGGAKPSLEDLHRRIETTGYLSIKFTGTRGGTDLGIAVDRAACDLGSADFEQGNGILHVEGTLVLNDDPVRCIADIDLATLAGTGHLVLVEEAVVAAG
jgi:hypothetical protein